jgi:hypothetical protein
MLAAVTFPLPDVLWTMMLLSFASAVLLSILIAVTAHRAAAAPPER